ncbi:MAG: sugar kinase [Aestuariivita sp.]|nr:sugar kinase [Aestuariivita sp.]MCY4347852.1 sugar kinase [Aestuariivita sp.]
MIDLLCLGEPLVEFNQQQDGRFLFGYGGDVSNVAIAAARQGTKSAIICRIGSDKFGDDLRNLWQREGVADEFVLTSITGETGIYFITYTELGHKFSYRRKSSAASEFTPDDLPRKVITNGKVFYASGISLAISDSMCSAVKVAIDIARGAGRIVAFDPNLRLKLWSLEQARQTIHNIMTNCDIALPSIDDAKHLTGFDQPDQIVAFYHDLGASEVVLTLGSDGVYASDGAVQKYIDPVRLAAIDATGAGDCFNGTYIAARLRNLSTFQAAKWANVSAALSTLGAGAVARIPTLAETHEHLKQMEEHNVN